MTLTGLDILIPRGGEAGERWATAVAARGGRPHTVPLIATADPLDPAALTAAAEAWNRGDFDWLVLTSAAGARAFAAAGARAAAAGATGSAAAIGAAGATDAAHPRVAAVGPATAAELRAHGFAVDLEPATDFSGEGLAAALGAELDAPARILLPVSEIADDTVESALAGAGHRVERVTAYRTVPATGSRRATRELARGVDIVLVSSGSVARELARSLAPLPPLTIVIAMGPPTARALDDAGITPDAVASEHTVDGMLDAADRLLAPGAASALNLRSVDAPHAAPAQ